MIRRSSIAFTRVANRSRGYGVADDGLAVADVVWVMTVIIDIGREVIKVHLRRCSGGGKAWLLTGKTEVVEDLLNGGGLINVCHQPHL